MLHSISLPALRRVNHCEASRKRLATDGYSPSKITGLERTLIMIGKLIIIKDRKFCKHVRITELLDEGSS